MPDLLIEHFSEEIPARMQRRAGEDLKKIITNGRKQNEEKKIIDLEDY